MKVPRPNKPRFESKFQRHESGCWNWTGGLVYGYGQFTPYRGKNTRAHRFSYELYVGEIPHGLCVLHRCDNRACVNPGHLFLGTNLDNTRDMIAKGRRKGYAKLTAEQKKLALNASMTPKQVAEALGVTPERVNQIRRDAGVGIGRGKAEGSRRAAGKRYAATKHAGSHSASLM